MTIGLQQAHSSEKDNTTQQSLPLVDLKARPASLSLQHFRGKTCFKTKRKRKRRKKCLWNTYIHTRIKKSTTSFAIRKWENVFKCIKHVAKHIRLCCIKTNFCCLLLWKLTLFVSLCLSFSVYVCMCQTRHTVNSNCTLCCGACSFLLVVAAASATSWLCNRIKFNKQAMCFSSLRFLAHSLLFDSNYCAKMNLCFVHTE